ncbi:cob(I)yrinic acid a,c-diamide adenosyltransferase [Elusimicrobiota bacterium]
MLTGRSATQGVIDIADLVSEIREIKHPYEHGAPMQKGIEY